MESHKIDLLLLLTQEDHGPLGGDGLLDDPERLLLCPHSLLGAELGRHLLVDGHRGLEHHAVDEDGLVAVPGGQQVGEGGRFACTRGSTHVQAPRPSK